MAGLDEDADMFAGVVPSARRRGLWLGVNLATAFLAAWVVGLFETTIQNIVALAVLMPIVASMGGVAATQTLTLIVRGLALGQVERTNARWLMTKEFAVALLNGLAWATVVAIVAMLWFRNWKISAVIFAAMVVNLVAAALAGVAVPLALKRFGVDPAMAGGVIVTTVTDVVGFASLLGLGTLVLL
jgi:magnesium transporter